VRIRANLPEGGAQTGAIPNDSGMKSVLIPEGSDDSHAGDILLFPIAIIAFWTLAYDLVLVARWPAQAITWCFLAFAVAGGIALARLWTKTRVIRGKRYRFHPSQLLLLALGLGYAITALFVRRPNQDDVVYFHRALSQLLDLQQPIFLRQTSVDMDAAAFSPVHLTTSYEMIVAFLAHYSRINPLYCYQVVAHFCAAFSVPFVFYWCARIFGLDRWPAAIGAVLAMSFLLFADKSSFGVLLGAAKSLEGADPAGWVGFSTVAGYLWQGKAIVLILFLPIALALNYRFLGRRNPTDLVWLTLVGIAGVGFSNPALYLLPAISVCSWVAFFSLELFERGTREGLWKPISLGLLLVFPLVYPLGILALLKMDIIPKPIDIHMLGPRYMPWSEAVDYAVGGRAEYLRDVVLMITVPLLIVRARTGFFLFSYLCAVWLLCLNPLLAHWWMGNILAPTYFRLVYLLQLPLLCALIATARPQLAHKGNVIRENLTTVFALSAIVVSFVGSYHGISILPKNPRRGIAWKAPGECQLLPANLDFAKAADKYIAHAKLLAPIWTAGCELPLLFPEMKVVAPRLVAHYFANAGNPEEGDLRNQAEAFINGDRGFGPDRLKSLEPKFRQVIETGRANAVAVPESQSQRVLATLKSIDPGWHRVLEAGDLVLMLPGTAEQRD